ncbi:MAG: alpha-glucosidase/alpha-galactosidase, partial [Spirochaetaceae bacterium]|nr:alpha-glucosidase/alpha-galactosidase [Spirochaetaceae bacterium]
MKREANGRRDGLVIAYVGGGSRGWAWRLMADLASEGRLSGTVRLYDIERPAAEVNAVIGNRLSSRPDAAGNWKYEVAPTLSAALKGADFVIASILPGTFDDMASDVHAPEALGVWQSVGDTTGPGGVLRSLRTIPQYIEIARAVRDECPEAWVVNYTNPMALCLRTLHEVFPGVKAFGCCHEVFGTRRLLAKVAQLELGMDGARMAEVEVNVLGINHFTWLDAASCRGADLLPAYRRFVDAHFKEGFEGMEGEAWNSSWFSSGERVKFDLFRRFGRIAAAGDRHLAEFMPPWYLKDPATAASWKFSLTPVSWRAANAQELRARAARLAAGTAEFDLSPSGEEGVAIIAALCGLGSIAT